MLVDPDGEAFRQELALRQYLVDRDGNPVLTTDGRPVHFLLDERGNPSWMRTAGGRWGRLIPPGSHVEAGPRRPDRSRPGWR